MNIQVLIEIFRNDRFLTWPFIVIAYLLITLIVRKIAFSKIRHKVRHMDRRVFKKARKDYQKNALLGWAFYLLSVLVLVATWLKFNFPWVGDCSDLLLISFFLILFFLSIIVHLRAIFISALDQIQLTLEQEEE